MTRFTFQKVATLAELPPGTMKPVNVHDKWMVLCNVGGTVYACNHICPHSGGPLGEGKLEGSVITCPWHGWSFDAATGRGVASEGHGIATYEVKVEEGAILVGWLKGG